MFDLSYDFEYVMCEKSKGDDYIRRHIYTFTGFRNQKYLVFIEECASDIFSVKFHLKNHSRSERRYHLLTGGFQAARVIRTCVNIALDFFRNNLKASFVFVGVSMSNEVGALSKRFRIYRMVIQNFFSPIQFEHRVVESKNLYILLNNDSEKEVVLRRLNGLIMQYQF